VRVPATGHDWQALEVAAGLTTISKVLVGTDVSMRAALARLMLDTVRQLIT